MWKPTSQGEDHMQANGFPQSIDEYPLFLQQDTDTASSRPPVPIYYIHDLSTPFCSSFTCVCQRGKTDAARLLGAISEGTYMLQDAALLVEDVPVFCQDYGHSWERTEHPDVKQCYLCHVRGYCPGCTPFPPSGAKPFYCTRHAAKA